MEITFWIQISSLLLWLVTSTFATPFSRTSLWVLYTPIDNSEVSSDPSFETQVTYTSSSSSYMSSAVSNPDESFINDETSSDVGWHDADFETQVECSPVNPVANGPFTWDNPMSLPKQCGEVSRNALRLLMRRKVEDQRVVNGITSDANEWPWLAAIGLKDEGHRCGAALITERHVLTAAHCLDNIHMEYPCSWNIRLGEHDLLEDEGVDIDVEAVDIRVHPKYDAETHKNDIAIIKLKEKVDTRKREVTPICLPENMKEFPPGTPCYTAGWGATSSEGPSSSTVLHAALPLLSFRTCQVLYESGGYPPGTIAPGMMCAGFKHGGTDSCQGDSGGPLMCKSKLDNMWYLVGIVSWGEGCGLPGYPGVYTSTTIYRTWIMNNLY